MHLETEDLKKLLSEFCPLLFTTLQIKTELLKTGERTHKHIASTTRDNPSCHMVPIIHLLLPHSKQTFHCLFYDNGTVPSKWFSFATGVMYTKVLLMEGVGGTLQEEETF